MCNKGQILCECCFSLSSEYFAQNAVVEIRRIRHTGARSEIVVAGGSERARNAQVFWVHPTAWSGRELGRLQAWDDSFDFALYRTMASHLPSQAEVEGQVRLGFVRVLHVKGAVARAGIEKLLAALVVAEGRPIRKSAKSTPVSVPLKVKSPFGAQVFRSLIWR